MKKTLSMRKTADPKELEMQEKCDLADAVERYQLKEIMDESKKVKGFAKLWPIIRPKPVMFIGVFMLMVGSVNNIVTGTMMGRFMGVLSVPLDDKVMQKLYPDSGLKKAVEILKYEI